MSRELISEFKTGHQAIVESIDAIQGKLRSYLGAKPAIRGIQEVLFSHFGRQDEKLLKALQRAFAGDRPSLKMIEFLAHDLKDLKIKFLIFFDKYSGEMGDMGSRNFPKDFMEFSGSVISRIKIEEEYLFPLLEKLPE